jgi:hypothetical protein
MYDVNRILARAQVGLTFTFTFGFFAMLFLLMYLHKDMSTTEVTILTGLVSVLGTLLTQQIMFFFGRPRPTALPDPTTTTTSTQTTTTPTPLTIPPGTTVTSAPTPPVIISETASPLVPPGAKP